MDIAFLALVDQLLEIGRFITALEMIDMNNRPLLSVTCLEQGEVITRYKLGVWVKLKQGKINSVLLFMYCTLNCKSSAGDSSLQMIFLHLHSIWSINARWSVYLLMGHTANFA